MTESKTFEDKFDHDPNAVYTEENDDIDLGPDDEFADTVGKPAKPNISRPGTAPSGGGCLGGLFKVALSLGIIAFCYFYIFQPEKFTALEQKIIQITSSGEDGRLPLLSMKAPNAEETASQPVRQPPQIVPSIVLRGAGTLPDFSTAAKNDASLNFYLIEADQLRFETLDTYHDLLTKMIADWVGETDPKKIEQITGMTYKQFFNQVSVSLLSQTVLKQAGLTPSGTSRIIRQDPIQAMASVYPLLKEAMAAKTTVRDQLKTIEPVSSFLIYICRGSSECLASWDLLIDMLGAKKYARILEKAPENIYLSSGN
ncbi:MAG: hypothetical protein J6L82_11160 [Alphaproteobacteria bacterium]|nr:hypothetical protein [Alphaproteobacteria bacterium]